MGRKKKVWWKKHSKCKSCEEGFTYDSYEYLCGSSGIKKNYCESCRELWEEDFIKIKSRGNIDKFGVYKKLFRIPASEELARFVILNRRKSAKRKIKK